MKKFKSANGLKYHLRKSHNIEPVASKIKPPSASRSEEVWPSDFSNLNFLSDILGGNLPAVRLITKQLYV